MAVSKATEYISGKIFWAKVLGDPRPNYDGNAREWSFEIEPDDAGKKVLKDHKIADRLKDKLAQAEALRANGEDERAEKIEKNYAGRKPFLVLKKSELSKDGERNSPIRIYDSDNNKWDDEVLLGNGTEVDVKLDIRDYGPGKKKGVYPVAIRVTNLEPYEADYNDFGPSQGKPKEEVASKRATKKDTFAEDFGLDDPLP